jgi:hypothetical protein
VRRVELMIEEQDLMVEDKESTVWCRKMRRGDERYLVVREEGKREK